ncbi:lymphocyte antigen 6A-2/6E-1-like isoform X2 [Dunckerocampus dactyliophorus]|uniref:lymphocyte antigen 6A-2/6E-1-like isoform X2 n=1 Tax=Dunckerocampus dactyliophorus TaxID=161453 RepID=UPI0024053347|nr:lymphocyte antigen 6A-2/6E-1-like isoform X2 [Dunckerocampus dactyliophorus]
MHHLLLIFGIFHLPKVATLKCYECAAGSSGSCIDATKECPPLADQCGALRLIVYGGDEVIADVNGKSCTFADHCVEVSVNFGATRTIFTNRCCTTDLCNSLPAPDISKSRPNGKKCFSCNGLQCTTSLDCQGNEHYCVTAIVDVKGQSRTMRGCASKQMCSNTQQLAALIGAQVSCCEGDYCNSGNTQRAAGLLLVAATLLSLVMLH